MTGADNAVVRKNLEFLWRKRKLEEIRIVCLPGESDYEDVLRGIAGLLGSPITVRVKLIKFRPFGVRGRLSGASQPGDGLMRELASWAGELEMCIRDSSRTVVIEACSRFSELLNGGAYDEKIREYGMEKLLTGEMISRAASLLRADAVSYTHLDVYKRQL